MADESGCDLDLNAQQEVVSILAVLCVMIMVPGTHDQLHDAIRFRSGRGLSIDVQGKVVFILATLCGLIMVPGTHDILPCLNPYDSMMSQLIQLDVA